MIDDLELRDLFRAESEEHFQILESGLLRLEANPDDLEMLEDLFRSAHSLKGAARMLGVGDLETLAHHFEDELGAARRGRQKISSEGADRLYQGLDAMRRFAAEATTGEAPSVDLAHALARLRGEMPLPGPHQESRAGPDEPPLAQLNLAEKSDVDLAEPPEPATSTIVHAIAVSESPLRPRPSGEEEHGPSVASFKIETVRVEPQKLDSLTTLAGEMGVIAARTTRGLRVVRELAELWEEWNREAHSPHRRPSQDSGKLLKEQKLRESNHLSRIRGLLDRLECTRDEEIARLGLVADEMIESIRDIRLLPFSTIFNLFLRLVRDLGREQGKEVRLELVGASGTADKHLLEELKDPLMHMIRNAVDHAIELPEERERLGKPREATIWLRAVRRAGRMIVEVEDDGRGLDESAIRRVALQKLLIAPEAIAALSSEQVWKLIFEPGFSTSPLVTDVSGRGVGMDVVRTNIDRLKGSISVHSEPGKGCRFRIDTPISLEITRVLLVRVAQGTYALPLEAIEETFIRPADSTFTLSGRTAIQWSDGPVPVALLSDLLEFQVTKAQKPSTGSAKDLTGVFLTVGEERVGILVDALLDEQEVIFKPFGGLLQRVRNVLGSTILSSGEICMVLNPKDLIATMRSHRAPINAAEPKIEKRKKVVLLAEDSMTTRTQEKRILEGAGYSVVTAVDGADAFLKLSSGVFDAVVTDVEMPNMTGLELAARIRLDSKYVELPIILVTSLASDADRQRGVEVGANAYLTKGNFEQKLLLETLRRLA